MIRPTSTSLLLLTGLAVTGLAGCVEDGADAPMRIVANIAPGEGCTVDSSSNVFIDDGLIDAMFTEQGYVFTPAVVNEITLVDGESAGPKTIYVEGARVTIAFYDTARFPAGSFDAGLLEFQVPTSGSIEPEGGTAAFSFEIVPLELIRAVGTTLGTGARTTLDVRIQMFGTKGGGDVESKTFRYPVQICVDCLLVDRGSCASLPASFTPSIGGACNVYQDANLDCCDSFAVCPAARPMGA